MLHICGKLLSFGNSDDTLLSIKGREKFICLSEDDGGALVWNDELNFFISDDKHEHEKFHNMNIANDTSINCEMNANTDCLETWSRVNWILTNSVKTPMGPVFDQRWEGRRLQTVVYTFDMHADIKYIALTQCSEYLKYSAAGALSFSTRSTYAIEVCNTKNILDISNVCYRLRPFEYILSAVFSYKCKNWENWKNWKSKEKESLATLWNTFLQHCSPITVTQKTERTNRAYMKPLVMVEENF